MGIFTDKAIEMESAAKTHIAKARVAAKANYENTLADIDQLERALTGTADKPPWVFIPKPQTLRPRGRLIDSRRYVQGYVGP
jgi:hypothetical protein